MPTHEKQLYQKILNQTTFGASTNTVTSLEIDKNDYQEFGVMQPFTVIDGVVCLLMLGISAGIGLYFMVKNNKELKK